MRNPFDFLGVLMLAALGCGRGGLASGAPAPASWPADSAAALGAAGAFVAALDSLQWEPFRASLAPDVSVFMPLSEFPARLDGRDTVAGAFHAFFDAARAALTARGISRPPYFRLQPHNWSVQRLAPGAVLVTFELGPAGQPPSRRTLVLRRAAGSDRWELVHLHGSAAPQRAPPAGSPGAAGRPTRPPKETSR